MELVQTTEESELVGLIKKHQLQARKDRNKDRIDILTSLLSEILIVGKNNGNRETTNEEAIRVIKKFKNGVELSIESLQGSHNYENCTERIEDLRNELAIYDTFLPRQMSEEDLRTLLNVWKETNYVDSPTIGGYMSALKRVYDGFYDGKMASRVILEILKP